MSETLGVYVNQYDSDGNLKTKVSDDFEKVYTSYSNFINELNLRNKQAFLSIKTVDSEYQLSFSDGRQSFKYTLDHSNTDEKNDFDINYLNTANKTIDTTHNHSLLKHFTIENTQTVNMWTPAQDYVLHLTSIYFHGHCNVTSKTFSLSIEIDTIDGWVELSGITINNTEESFREYIPYSQHLNMKKGNGNSVRMRAKITTTASIGDYSVKISLTGFEVK